MYKQFLFWLLGHLALLPTLWTLVQSLLTATTWQERGEILKGIIDVLLPALDDFPAVVPASLVDLDDCALETQVCEAMGGVAAADVTATAWDGSKLRKLFEIVGPLLPILLTLFK